MQLSALTYTKNTTKLLDLAYSYTSATYSGNNGQLTRIQDNTGTPEAGRTADYTYDAWSRLKTAVTTGSASYPQWGLSWDYDRYGNRKNQNVTAGSAPAPQLAISPTTNRITSTGYTYDSSGNLTNDAVYNYTYDAENRIIQAKQGSTVLSTSTYDGTGLRVKKVAGSNTTRYIFSGSKVIAEYLNGSLNKEYIYGGSQLLATLNSSGTPTYHHPDHLSNRVNTDSSGNIARQFGHYPFGEIWYETGTADKWKFTSYERDSESSLDYAVFRYHSPRIGRFMTTDPICGDKYKPQVLNKYSYVSNDPANMSDPQGLRPRVGVITSTGGIVGGFWSPWDNAGFLYGMLYGGQSSGYCPANEQYCTYGGLGVIMGSSGNLYNWTTDAYLLAQVKELTDPRVSAKLLGGIDPKCDQIYWNCVQNSKIEFAACMGEWLGRRPRPTWQQHRRYRRYREHGDSPADTHGVPDHLADRSEPCQAGP